MSIILELKPEVEERLRESAARRGQTVETYLAEWFERFPEETEPLPRTPAEAIEYWRRLGVFENAPSGPDSPELARLLREREEARQTGT